MNKTAYMLTTFVLFFAMTSHCRPSVAAQLPQAGRKPLLTLVYSGGLGGNISSCG